MDYRKYIAEKLKIENVTEEEISSFIEIPPDANMGDYALPCFKLSKILHSSPIAIAESLANAFSPDDVIESCEALKGYLNFKINRKGFAEKTLESVLIGKEKYGSDDIGNGKTICIDYSSINIAKPFHIGHLSTTVIGSALCKIYRFLGYNVVGINHLGDYGTQFGKLIVAYKKWSSFDAVKEGRLKELTRIYVKFHEEAKIHPELDDEARHYFKLIEDGDKESNELFSFFKEITLQEVDKIYKLLNVTFDSYAGESFYNDKMAPVVKELKDKKLLKKSEGAEIVDLEEYGMPPCLILKSDGSSLYATRDIAAAIYRKKKYDFYKCLYVVAYQQNLHFRQFFKVIDLMGYDWAKDLVHVAYGMVSLEDGAMSTRTGNVVLLEDVINKTVEKARKVIEEKNPDIPDKETTAKAVGVGAVIFSALSNNKIKDIVFSYDRVLSFEGETCPYLQYTVARCNSLLKKCGDSETYTVTDVNEDEYAVISAIGRFNETVKAAGEKYEPSLITRYALDLASVFNKFYINCKIATEREEIKNFRLSIVKGVKITLTNALSLLGIDTVEQM
ncbi:MAG: arginine--tRNA ligase [Candidatus Borkfalkiaceae bacterium]|nr:arginine--tRNA ligase [Christensenellaceae bacterium]